MAAPVKAVTTADHLIHTFDLALDLYRMSFLTQHSHFYPGLGPRLRVPCIQWLDLEHLLGIEPKPSAWETRILPLSHDALITLITVKPCEKLVSLQPILIIMLTVLTSVQLKPLMIPECPFFF